MRSRPLNPYYNMMAIRQQELFFGRRVLLQQLFSLVAHHQSVSLLGPRHIGKSSVLRSMYFPAMQQHVEEDLSRHIFVWLDLREFPARKTADDFFEQVNKQIATHCAGRVDLQIEDEEERAEIFRALLDQVNEQEYHLVLLMDAFDNIARNPHFDLEFFSFLRSQATKVSYVTASVTPLPQICHRAVEESPFFNIFAMYPVGPLMLDEARELIQVPSASAGVPFSAEECEWVLRQAGRHPFFIQRVCHYLFEEKVAQDGQPINRHRIKGQAYNELQHHFEANWERLDDVQRDQLRNEAQRKGERERQLPELSESGLFRQFVRDKYQIHLFRMNIDLIESVLDDIDNFKALGESDLRHLKSVSQRLKNNGLSSALERGAAVRSVLTDAFESLHGVGTRSDEGPGWELYNILYYRYFKYHMKNEQIVGRLGMTSTRKFYRQRQRAIETLFNNLIEMELLAGGNDDD